MAVHSSFKSFAKSLFSLSLLIEKNAAQNVEKATIAGLTAMVQATPVDEGTARSNWNVSKGSPDGTIREAYTSGHDLGLNEGANAAKTIEEGIRNASGYVANTGGIFITNNLPYIVYLDEGSSQQAPEGMLNAGTQAAREALRKLKLAEV